MLEKYNQFYNWWVHPKVHDDELSDQITWEGILVHSSLIIVFTSFLIVYYFYNYTTGIYASLFGIFTSSLILIGLRYIPNTFFLFNSSLIFFTLTNFLFAYGDGGILSHYSMVYVAVIWWSFYYNTRIGFQTTALLFIWLLFWAIVQRNGFIFPNTLSPKDHEELKIYFILTAFLTFTMVFWFASQNDQRMRARLKKAQQQLIQQDKMASIGILTAGVAHEINNPINYISNNVTALDMDFKELKSILTLLQFLNQENKNRVTDELISISKTIDIPTISDEIEQLLTGLKNGSKKISTIVKSLQYLSHEDNSAKVIADIHQPIESALTILNNKINSTIKIIKIYSDCPKISMHPAKISQVFLNIIDNAIFAVGKMGWIKITTKATSSAIIITIEDNGKGISPEVKDRIFEPFFTTKDIGQGTGLGLSISYGIIQAHQGTLQVDSELDKGTTIQIVLPIQLV